MVFAEFELPGRTQHALAFHTAQLALLDAHRLAIGISGIRGWQLSTHQGQRHADADTGVRCTANNLQQPLRRMHTCVDLADAQTIGIRVLHSLDDFCHHDVGKGRRHRTHGFDLQAGHGEQVRQLSGRNGRVAKLAQPGFRELHDESS